MSGQTLETFSGALKKDYHPKLRKEAMKKKMQKLAQKELNKRRG